MRCVPAGFLAGHGEAKRFTRWQSDPWRLRWGQTAKVLPCLSSSRSRLRSDSVCRWKDTLTSVCRELGSLHRSLRERMAAIPSPSSRHTASAGSSWLALLYLTHETGRGFFVVFFFFKKKIITEVVSTSLTLVVSPAGYCWTLPQALRGVCVTWQRQRAAARAR